MSKPNLTRTYDQTIKTEDHGDVRLAITVNAWLPEAIDPTDDDLKVALKEAAGAVERVLFDTPELAKPACKDCRFFAVNHAQCRKRTPMTQLLERWPIVQTEDWCGEFEPSHGAQR